MHLDPSTGRACFGAVVSGGKLDDIVVKTRAATRSNLVIIAVSHVPRLLFNTLFTS